MLSNSIASFLRTKDASLVLDSALENLEVRSTFRTVDELVDGLYWLRRDFPKDAWRSFVAEECRFHPIRRILLEDPFTGRFQAKPNRGADDPGFVDLVYGEAPLPEDTSESGRAVFGFTSQSQVARSLIERRDTLGYWITRNAEYSEPLRVLSVSCGHMREAHGCPAITAGRISEWLGIDPDPDCVDKVNSEQYGTGVHAIVGTPRSILENEVELGSFDLIYAAGLYDYLDDTMAKELTSRLFEMLNPEGSLLVSNFAPSLRESGYMEAFMSWNLHYRDEDEMETLAGGIDPSQAEPLTVFWDSYENIVFLEVTKR